MSFNYYIDKKLPQPISAGSEDYFLPPNDPLVAALEVALHLGRPLLLTGAPGTGKTKFAHHVAKHFSLDGPYCFYAKTTSTATDLFYRYDAVRHFNLSQNGRMGEEDGDFERLKIIRLGAFGDAIRAAENAKNNLALKRPVVLIDEIDKAPRDFPNDLLQELDGVFKFSIPEWDNKEFEAPEELKPVLIITSNSEKNLPEPFMRRCVYHHISFPNNDNTLFEIVIRQMPNRSHFDDETLRKLIARFLEIRKRADNAGAYTPATAELIGWLAILHDFGYKKTENIPDASFAVVAKDENLRKILIENCNKPL